MIFHLRRAVSVSAAQVQEATTRSLGRAVNFADYARSMFYNGLGRCDDARRAAWRVFEQDPVGYGSFVVPELAEAAARTGDIAAVRAALAWLSERARVAPTQWRRPGVARPLLLAGFGLCRRRRARRLANHPLYRMIFDSGAKWFRNGRYPLRARSTVVAPTADGPHLSV